MRQPSRRAVGWTALACSLALGALSGCARPAGGAPEVAESSARRVIFPTRFGWLSSKETTGALPSAIALGGTSGRVLLYLEFPPQSEGRRLVRADLVLSPGGSAADAVDVEVTRSKTAGRKLEAWSDQPSSIYPRVDARVSGGGLPARLDVTELLRAHSKPGEPFCMLVKAEPSDGAAVPVATGAAGGDGPRLEAYWE